MAFRKKSSWSKPESEQAPQGQRPIAFVIKESPKTGKPYASISGRIAKVGRGGAMLMIFPSKFEGTFAGLSVNGWGRGMIPVSGDQIDVDEKTGTLMIDFGWLKITARGDNAAELVEFLNYVAGMPREKSGFQQEVPPPPQQPQTRSWKK